MTKKRIKIKIKGDILDSLTATEAQTYPDKFCNKTIEAQIMSDITSLNYKKLF